MTPFGETQGTRVPRPPVQAVAAAAALAAGAAGVAALAPKPVLPEVERGAGVGAAQEAIPVADPDGAAALAPVVAGLSSDDPVVRRESAGVVERLTGVPDPQVRIALAAALRRDGRRPARLALLLLAGDADERVRRLARATSPASPR